jgi:hypothetical protein
MSSAPKKRFERGGRGTGEREEKREREDKRIEWPTGAGLLG